MADKRTAKWHQMDDDDWVVHFTDANGDHVGTYRPSDFYEVQDLVDAWIQDGRLPDDQVEESDTYDEYRDSYLFNDYE
mgnify:CR=1 FL=1